MDHVSDVDVSSPPDGWPGTHWAKHPVGTALAALLLAGSMVAYMLSGGAQVEADAGAGGGVGGGVGGGSRPPTSVLQALPACRVDVASNGIGSQRHHHVTVVLDNDVRALWLVVDSASGTRTIEVPARNGWAQVALADEEQPTRVVVYGSSNLEPYFAGCVWSA